MSPVNPGLHDLSTGKRHVCAPTACTLHDAQLRDPATGVVTSGYERHTVKDEPDMRKTIRFVRHRAHPRTGDVVFAWAYGDVHVTLTRHLAGTRDIIVTRIADALRATSHWDDAAHIEIELAHCTHAECLCLVLTAGDV